MSLSPLFTEADVIHVYTRAQALADGVLMDVSVMAREAGFKVPVAVTAAVWSDCVAWPREDAGQDEQGRLWDVLTMARLEAGRHGNLQVVPFKVLRVPRDGTTPQLTQLTLHIGPGDDAEPVITILLPGED
ncbi:DUF6573 family protein [Thiorhodococcus mannitoliphagus]|uniref:DUF6573 family protein n=1 Tax=Thiorhodococcus mannitoliphagus TaxID=329406 RepID=UPI00197D3C9C|nr:DUF6573 family protein [Thiorhodococcus mannitoliphagus]